MLFLKRLTFLLLLSSTAFAEVYRWTNDRGEVEFSDQYRPGAEKVEVAPVSTIRMTDTSKSFETSPSSAEEGEAAPRYPKFEITYPEAGSAFHSGSGDITVRVAVDPELAPSHRFRLTFDGEVKGLSKQPWFSLKAVSRGDHTAIVEVVNRDEVIQTASPVSFHLHRPSQLLGPIRQPRSPNAAPAGTPRRNPQ